MVLYIYCNCTVAEKPKDNIKYIKIIFFGGGDIKKKAKMNQDMVFTKAIKNTPFRAIKGQASCW